MKFCAILLRSEMASFRNPDFQNFQKTYALPPPATLIGLAGAALGKGPKASQEFFYEGGFSFGVYGKHSGKVKDLWKYNNFAEGSVLLREFMYSMELRIVYAAGNDDGGRISLLKEAFESPVYALTLGNSDSLAKVAETKLWEGEPETSKLLENCLAEGDVVAETLANAEGGWGFSVYSTSEALVQDMPLWFDYEKEYGARALVKRKSVSMIGNPMKLNVPQQGVFFGDAFIPLFKI